MLNIYKRIKYLILILFFGFLLQDCNVINPAEPIPTYIHVDSFTFKRATGSSFADTLHQISCVWAYYNGNPIGSFDLPANIPVITSGTGILELSPGIAIDGLNNLLGTYPFYQTDTFTFAANPGKTIIHQPFTEYFSSTIINKISDFQGTAGFLGWEGIPSAITTVGTDSLVLNPPESVGCISLYYPSVDSCVDSSTTSFVIPSGSAYIELDYRCDIPFAIGLQANIDGISSTPYYLAGIYPSAIWQKFYLAVADFAAQYPATSYNFYIKSTLPSGQTSGKIYLAYIHLVHF